MVALLFCGFVGWKITHPPLTPEQQIRANMNGLTRAVRNTSPRAIIGYLAPEFKWNKTSRDEAERLIREASISATQVEVTRTAEKIEVRGESATATGDFTIRYRLLQESKNVPAHSSSGQYVVTWQKQADGNWKIAQIDGGPDAPNPAISDSLF